MPSMNRFVLARTEPLAMPTRRCSRLTPKRDHPGGLYGSRFVPRDTPLPNPDPNPNPNPSRFSSLLKDSLLFQPKHIEQFTTPRDTSHVCVRVRVRVRVRVGLGLGLGLGNLTLALILPSRLKQGTPQRLRRSAAQHSPVEVGVEDGAGLESRGLSAAVASASPSLSATLAGSTCARRMRRLD